MKRETLLGPDCRLLMKKGDSGHVSRNTDKKNEVEVGRKMQTSVRFTGGNQYKRVDENKKGAVGRRTLVLPNTKKKKQGIWRGEEGEQKKKTRGDWGGVDVGGF